MKIDELYPILTSAGVVPSKGMGQHFLLDEGVCRRQAEFAELSKDDVVLEVGPGIGTLTRYIAEAAKKVIAVEKDARLATYLKNSAEWAEKNVDVIHGDALKAEFPPFNKIVSNIPYNISSDITFKFLEHKFDLAVILYQKEFAERLVAVQGGEEYSRLSVNAYYRAKAEIVGKVHRSSFYPPPKVDSAIVRLAPRKRPAFLVKDEKLFFKTTLCIFNHRRKKIRNCLINDHAAFGIGREEMRAFADKNAFADKRAEELEPEEMGTLADELYDSI